MASMCQLCRYSVAGATVWTVRRMKLGKSWRSTTSSMRRSKVLMPGLPCCRQCRMQMRASWTSCPAGMR